MEYPICEKTEIFNPTANLKMFVSYYASAFKNKQDRLNALLHDNYCKKILGNLYQGMYEYFEEVE